MKLLLMFWYFFAQELKNTTQKELHRRERPKDAWNPLCLSHHQKGPKHFPLPNTPALPLLSSLIQASFVFFICFALCTFTRVFVLPVASPKFKHMSEPKLEPLQLLRQRWELASVLNFLHVSSATMVSTFELLLVIYF
jgi:hypothetical protein